MNCKPGDLAIIISTQNSGAIVEVLEYHGDAYGWHDMWLVQPTSKLQDFTGERSTEVGLCRDAILRPVSGLDNTDETERERDHASQEPA